MSPHAVLQDQEQPGTPSVDLTKFAVTQNAFLPSSSPPTALSDTYYEPWELIAQHLAPLIDSGRIRQSVDGLPVLSTDQLTCEAEWRRAYVILAFMSHAYIWGGDKPSEVSERV